MRVKLRLFGGCDVRSDERALPVGYDLGKILLAWLALHPGPCSRDALGEHLWPEEPEGVAKRRLREVVYRLRRGLQDSDRLHPLLVGRKGQLMLSPGPDLSCDVLEFDALILKSREHAHHRTSTCPSCLERLRRADALYTGPLLDGITTPPGHLTDGIAAHRERRIVDACWMLETIAEHQLEGERWADALVVAKRIEAMRPLFEPALRLRMRALHAQGRRAELVEAYLSFAAHLEDAGRPPPDDTTEELYQAVVHDEIAHSEARGTRRIPAPVSPIIGRERELIAVLESLARPAVRLVTLVGMGGAGKTRLAVEIARKSAWRDGVYFVPAIDCTSPRDLLLAIRATLGLKGVGQHVMAELLAWLEGREVLWVLDNLEQVEGAAGAVNELLRGAEGLRVLVTSRERLGLRAEHLHPVRGLEAEHAHAMWLERARQLDRDLEVGPEQVSAICARLGGLPLALEFSAARVLDLSVRELADNDRTGLDLKTGFADVPDRQASLRVILGDTVAGLSPTASRAFARLAVFHGPFVEAAAIHICPVRTQDLQELTERSLLTTDGDRLTSHPIVADFAREQRGVSEDIRAAHRRWFLTLDVPTPRDRDDLREAWRSAWSHEDLALIASQAYALQRRLQTLGWHPESAAWFDQAHAHLSTRHPDSDAARRCLACAGLMSHVTGDSPLARERLTEAVAVARQHHAHADRVRALWWLAFVERNAGLPEVAVRRIDEALALCETHGLDEPIAHYRYTRATALYETGQLEAARAELIEAVSALRQSGTDSTAASASAVLGLCEVLLGDHRTGLSRYPDAVRTLRATGGMPLADALNGWACANLIAGRCEQAVHRARSARETYAGGGYRSGVASTSAWLALAKIDRGAADAEQTVRDAVRACLAAETERATTEAACVLARWLAASDQPLARDLAASVQGRSTQIAELQALTAPLSARIGAGTAMEPQALTQTLLRFDRD